MDHVFFCKQKTAYEMRISDWSSDVCSTDLNRNMVGPKRFACPIEHARGNAPEFEQPLHEQRGEEDRPQAKAETGKRHKRTRRSGGEACHAIDLTRRRYPLLEQM